MKAYFSIGEFAKLCGVSRDTLLYYDKINLIKPSYFDVNHYRYYSFVQYETVILINSLKQAKIPLKTIRSLISDKTPKALYTLLEETEIDLNNKINHLIHIRDKFHNEKLELQKAMEQIDQYKVVKYDKKPIIKIDKKLNSLDEIDRAIVEQFNFVKEKKINAANQIGFYGDLNNLIYDENNTIVTLLGSYISLIGQNEYINDYLDGQFLLIYLFTDFMNEKLFIEKTINFAKENNMNLSGKYFIETIVGEFFSKSKNCY